MAASETVAPGAGKGSDKNGANGSTPATVLLQKAGVSFAVHEFAHDATDRNYGTAAATALGIDIEIAPNDLISVLSALTAPIGVER